MERALVALFFASGATSLMYETLWVRELHLVFGVSQVAVSAVLAAFMAGLAMGAFLAGRAGHRIRRPLAAYAVLEAAIGLYALAFPLLLDGAALAGRAFWRAAEPGPALFGTFNFLLAFLLLLLPTMCMGATLPILARFATHTREDTGLQVGVLYGANTLGAVLGTAVAGFLLLPRIGLSATNHAMVAANLVIAAAAAAMARRSGRGEPAHTGPPVDTSPIPGRRLLYTIAALAGFAALLYEVAWFRLMTLVLGGSAYAFSIMLLAFLMGLGLGGGIGGVAAERAFRRGGRGAVLATLSWIEAGVALLAVAAIGMYGELPYMFVWLFTAVEGHLLWLWPATVLIALAVMFPPALLMGMALPCLVQAAAGDPRRVNRPVGRLYGFNTVGAVAGAALGGLFLLHTLTMRGSVFLAAGVNLAAAILARAAAARGAPRRAAGWSLAAAAAVLAIVFLVPPWNPLLMSSGMYVNVSILEPERRAREDVLKQAVDRHRLLYYREGLSSVVTVGHERDSDNVWMSTNGKVDASTRGDLATQLLVGHLPMLARPDAGSVLVIGYASGMTAGTVTRYDAPERVDVVELEPAVIEGSRWFDAYNGRPLEDPRVRLHVDDGRHLVSMAPADSWDVVVSEPSNPWLSGASNLFTREFYRLGRRALRPGGVWSQWLHTYGMAPSDLLSLLATFNDVFPHTRLFRVDAYDLVMLGSDAPIRLTTRHVERVLAREPDAAADIGRAGVERGVDVVARMLLSGPTIADLTGDVERNTDDSMRVEYSAPLHLHLPTAGANTYLLESRAEIPIDLVGGVDEMVALAGHYATDDTSPRRALAVLEVARAEHPGDRRIRALQALLEARTP